MIESASYTHATVDQTQYTAWSYMGLVLHLWYFVGFFNFQLSKFLDRSVRLEKTSNRFKTRHTNWGALTALPISENNENMQFLESTFQF